MAVSRRSTRPRFVLIVLVLASITLVTLDQRGGGAIPGLRGKARDVFSPVQHAFSSATSPLTNFFQGVFSYSQLRHDNARLREQIAALRAQQIQDQYYQQDNKDLTDLLKLDFLGDIPTVAARVVAGAESNFQVTVVIDRGTAAGIATGMPVVAGSGLVGRVIAVSDKQATVMLITDSSMGVGVQFAPSQAVGVAEGQGSGHPLDVTLVDPSLDTPVGTVAVTSGLAGSPYPRGIPVGKVTSDIAQPGIHGHAVTLAPVVDLAELSYVDVVITTAQTHFVTTPDAGASTTTTLPPPGATTVPP
jgi:rod shape-determining protein MreC